MNNTAAVCALVIVVVIGSLKCNANKTELIIAVLERRSGNTATSVGIDLAIEAAKNSSDLKAFFEKYEIVIDGPYYTKVRFVKETFLNLNIYRLWTAPKVNMAQLKIYQVLLQCVYQT